MRIIIAMLMALMLVGCEDGAGVEDSVTATDAQAAAPPSDVLAESEERNILEIRQLTPVSVTEGEAVTFTFDVAYNLVGYPQGVINIGFNSWNADSFVFLGEKAIVDEGMGVETFTVTVTPVRWEAPQAFKLNVSLSEYPHPSSWTPLVSVSEAIEVAAADARMQQRTAVTQQPTVVDDSGVIEACYEDYNLKTVYCNQY